MHVEAPTGCHGQRRADSRRRRSAVGAFSRTAVDRSWRASYRRRRRPRARWRRPRPRRPSPPRRPAADRRRPTSRPCYQTLFDLSNPRLPGKVGRHPGRVAMSHGAPAGVDVVTGELGARARRSTASSILDGGAVHQGSLVPPQCATWSTTSSAPAAPAILPTTTATPSSATASGWWPRRRSAACSASSTASRGEDGEPPGLLTPVSAPASTVGHAPIPNALTTGPAERPPGTRAVRPVGWGDGGGLADHLHLAVAVGQAALEVDEVASPSSTRLPVTTILVVSSSPGQVWRLKRTW